MRVCFAAQRLLSGSDYSGCDPDHCIEVFARCAERHNGRVREKARKSLALFQKAISEEVHSQIEDFSSGDRSTRIEAAHNLYKLSQYARKIITVMKKPAETETERQYIKDAAKAFEEIQKEAVPKRTRALKPSKFACYNEARALELLLPQPIAIARSNVETLAVGDTFETDGNASSDPLGKSLQFQWEVKTDNEHRSGFLTSLTSNSQGRFTIDTPGHYKFVLHVYARDKMIEREAIDSVEFDVPVPDPDPAKPVDKF
jgi:hypothetical protein